DAGRLERRLELKAPKQTFGQELTQALEPPKPPQEIVRYFRSVWPTAQETFTPDEMARASTLWNQLKDLTGADIQSGPDMAKWLVDQKLGSWSDLVVRFARRDAQGRLVDGVMVLDAVRGAARDLRVPPPDIPQLEVVGAQAIARLRHRREPFPAVDQPLHNLLTISRDLGMDRHDHRSGPGSGADRVLTLYGTPSRRCAAPRLSRRRGALRRAAAGPAEGSGPPRHALQP